MVDELKKCEMKLNASLEDLTSCLCEHPHSGSEEIHVQFKGALDQSFVVKAAAEKSENVAKDAINLFNAKLEEELAEELQKIDEKNKDAKNAQKGKPADDDAAGEGASDDAKTCNGPAA